MFRITMSLLNFGRTLSACKLTRHLGSWNHIRTMMTSAKRQARIAFVKLDDENERLQLSFKYESEFVADRLFTLYRRQDEPIEVSLARLQMNITGIAMKKFRKKKKKVPLEESTPTSGDETTKEEVKLSINIEDSSGTVIEPFIHNREAFQTGHILNIDGKKLPIVVNAPTVVRISLPKIIMTGFPVQAYVILDFANCSDCVFSWWRTPNKGETFVDYKEEDIIKERSFTWLRIHGECSPVFFPREEDIGRKLMVCCEPRCGSVGGVEISAVSSSVVSPPPHRCAFEDRHQFTAEILPDNLFRVVSYNLLADVYARTEFSKTVLFNYCPKDSLDFEYRKHLLIKEIFGYNGDLLCLQEVDRGMFKYELNPLLEHFGFEGIYGEKNGDSAEGCAVFYRKSKFSLVESKLDCLSESVKEDKSLADICSAIEKNSKLKERLTSRSTVLMRVLLRHKKSKRHLLVCNTHLYFHPDADHIRLLQSYISMRLAEEQLHKIEEQDHAKCALIFCGDFNSSPEFGVYQLFTTGEVPHDHEDWRSKEEEAISSLTARIKQKLRSAYGTPKYTNYTVDFKDCLDYIFHSKELSVDSVVPLPPHEVVAHPKYQAIPSPLLPSDHLALVVTLNFAEEKAQQ